MRRRISVVIPVYNEEARLPALLAALVAQTRPADELIVVDNASTDASAAVARIWGATVIRCEVPGVAPARQAGLMAASGDWVVSTDADSRPSPDWLSQLEAGMPGALAVYGPLRFCEVPPLTAWLSDRLYRVFLAACRVVKRPNLAGANMAFSREAALSLGGWPQLEASEDVKLGYALARRGRVRYQRRALVETSARRLARGWVPFLWQHARNLSGQTSGYFER